MKNSRWGYGLAGLFFLIMASDGQAAPAEPGELWQHGKSSIETVRCAPDRRDASEHCLAIRVASGTSHVLAGDGYEWVDLLWTRKPGRTGPDVVVLGNAGGSGGIADLIAISFSPHPKLWKIPVAPGDAVTLRSGKKAVCLNLPFGIGRLNGASHADTTYVSIPVCWSSGAFVLDDKALAARRFTDDDLRFRDVAIRHELGWVAAEAFPANAFYPVKSTKGTPITIRALADLMLTGHADVARDLLHRNWPRTHEDRRIPMRGEDRFWALLCRNIIQHHDWTFFHLDRLPHAEVIAEGAKSATE